ncbi:hypothetical protein SSX86_029907 [Deinandra increscens subsp. villosa]|uniref:ACB domain-containing protein n=1 Tax=Deinandra increscens subsp. villosa TaxID=3103831 RepID=A0AAP0CHF0_9ASTR
MRPTILDKLKPYWKLGINLVYTFYPKTYINQLKKLDLINRPIFEPLCRFEPSQSSATVMELFQELVFTISFSLIVSLLIVKLFSVASSCDDGNSTVSITVEEKMENEWVVCDSEKEGKDVCFKDPVKVSGDVDFGYVGDELGSGVVIKDSQSVGGVGACQVFDESPERNEVGDAGIDAVKSDEGNVAESVDVGEVKIDEEDEIFDEDWQGIEATELERSFGAAVAFMSSVDCVNLIDNEVKIRLYGLHQVAIEGSCFEPQPMALKLSARANWNSWKRLENLGREDAMEQYIALLSQNVPDWMERRHPPAIPPKGYSQGPQKQKGYEKAPPPRRRATWKPLPSMTGQGCHLGYRHGGRDKGKLGNGNKRASVRDLADKKDRQVRGSTMGQVM